MPGLLLPATDPVLPPVSNVIDQFVAQRKETDATLPRQFEPGAIPASPIPAIVDRVLGSPGQPLDPAARNFLEPRFGHYFGHVRIHADETAAESARAVGASAYTVGRDIAFGAGQYAPSSSTGRRLIAHELAHTIQQSRGTPVLQRAPLGDTSTESMHQDLEDQFTAAVGRPPVGGVHGKEYETWLAHPSSAARLRAIMDHEKEQGRVYRLVDQGLKHQPDRAKGTFDIETLFHNACEVIAAKRFRTVVLTKIHDALTRQAGLIGYFDPTVAWPESGGEYPEAASVTVDPHLSFAPRGWLGGYQQGDLTLVGTELQNDDQVRSTIVHETQHALDRTESPSRTNTHGIKPIYRVQGTRAPNQPGSQNLRSDTFYNQFQSEFRAYWIDAEEGSTRDKFGSSTAPAKNTRQVSGASGSPATPTSFANLRQENIFWHLVDVGAYDFVAAEYTTDPEFKRMVDGFTQPVGGNLVNSLRILELGDAIEASESSLDMKHPKVQTVLSKIRALDAIDRTFLLGPRSGPFWEHARKKLPLEALTFLLKAVAPPSGVGDFPPDPSMPKKSTAVA